MASVARFYVYVLCYPDGTPFYVGKGKKYRVNAHEWEAKRGWPGHKCNVIRKIWRQGGKVIRQIIFQTDNEQDAFRLEQVAIALYGRETLTNKTDGGEGASGITPELHDIFSERTRQQNALRWSKAESHQKLIQQNALRWSDPKQKENLAARNQRADIRQQVSRTRKAQWSDPTFREKMRKATHRKVYKFTSPTGELIEVSDLAEFCREHGLGLSGMCKVANGKERIHKGWTRGSQEV